jgi:mRNA interferase MazF
MVKGDIILIPFPFTDLSGNKNRPALVLIEGELDITVAFISTQLKWRENTDILIKPSRENGLKKDSIIRLSKLATIDKDLAIGRLGNLDGNSLNIVNHNLKILLKLE